MPILIVLLGAAGLGFFFITQSRKKGGNKIQFSTKGKEAGFTAKELEMLRRLAAQNNIHDPSTVFHSQEQFEMCIRSMVRGIKMSGESGGQEVQDFLSKLYDYRTKLEMDKSQNKNGIINSRQISEGQFLKVLVQGTGVFTSQIVKNTSQTLVISRPVNRKITQTISWEGMKISIYFWREGDAGYVFDTYVEDEVFSKGVSSLKISHNDALFRTQKRKSIRIRMHKAAFLYLLRDSDEPHRPETVPGLKCILEDVSDTGCAVSVGGVADADLRVKIQFALSNQPVCMPGTVRSATFKEDVNRSLLRIEADALPQYTRNLILGEVFGTQDGYDDDLPFQMLDEEAASIGGSGRRAEIQDASASDTSSPGVSDGDDPFAGFSGSPFGKTSADGDTANRDGV